MTNYNNLKNDSTIPNFEHYAELFSFFDDFVKAYSNLEKVKTQHEILSAEYINNGTEITSELIKYGNVSIKEIYGVGCNLEYTDNEGNKYNISYLGDGSDKYTISSISRTATDGTETTACCSVEHGSFYVTEISKVDNINRTFTVITRNNDGTLTRKSGSLE